MTIALSIRQARSLQLAAMGLLTPPPKKARKIDVLKTIHSMNMLQIDTISVVARSQYLVLWSRLGHYKNEWLDELLAEGALFEYWSHAACLLPIEHYPNYRFAMQNLELVGSERTALRLKTHRKQLDVLRKHVAESGEVRASDFERPAGKKGSGWWDWKPEKLLLETLYTAGELMVARREGFHRIYDLRERVLPTHLHDAPVPSQAELERDWTLAAVKAMGIATGRWIGDYFRHARRVPRPHPQALAEQGELIATAVEGFSQPAYVHRDHQSLLNKAAKNQLVATHTTLLSPFDPLVWDRERTLAMFDFDYRLECYTPEAKRIYGYFTLPVLRRGEIIGRIEAKAHRSDGVFDIKQLHLESGKLVDDALANDMADALADCAAWHQTPKVSISAPRSKLATALKARLKKTTASATSF
ncbi:MAG: winged helix-turn-helix domain-containing protein [Betaproteobacteria bacterium]|nr:MAG: winged helix-turn-helix domain-containing protein [Betaproteobacteria bacterium]